MKALVFGHGQLPDGSLDLQTEDRCQRAVESYERGEISEVYITASASKNGVMMADAMKGYLVRWGIPEEKIEVFPLGGNTAGELEIFLNEDLVNDSETVVLISTWYHIPRIFWLAMCRREMSLFTLRASRRHARPFGDVLMEIPKIINALFRPIKCAKMDFGDD